MGGLTTEADATLAQTLAATGIAVEERRADDRSPIVLRVEYKRLNAFFADYLRNVSRGSAFVPTDSPLAVGAQLTFELAVPLPAGEPGDGKLKLHGVVQSVVHPGDAAAGQPAGMFIKFVDRPPADAARVRDLARRLMRASLGDALADRLLAGGGAPVKR